jgi:hypothetical protein
MEWNGGQRKRNWPNLPGQFWRNPCTTIGLTVLSPVLKKVHNLNLCTEYTFGRWTQSNFNALGITLCKVQISMNTTYHPELCFLTQQRLGSSISDIWNYHYFITAFAKLRKATIGCAMSVRPPTRSQGTIYSSVTRPTFMKFDIWVFFENLARITGPLQDHLYTYMTSRPVLLTMRNVPDKNCRENPNALVMSNNALWKTAPFRRCGKILYSRIGHSRQYGAYALHAGCIRLHTHTLWISNTYWFYTAIMVAQTRLHATSYVHCLSCLTFKRRNVIWFI